MATMRLNAEGEGAIRGLVRACRNAGGYLAKMGDAAFVVLGRTGSNPAFGPSPQLPLWCADGRPYRMQPGDSFHCDPLACAMTAGRCVERQIENEKQLGKRRSRASTPAVPSRWQIKRYRGKAPDYPSCQTHLCPQGKEIRDRVERGDT